MSGRTAARAVVILSLGLLVAGAMAPVKQLPPPPEVVKARPTAAHLPPSQLVELAALRPLEPVARLLPPRPSRAVGKPYAGRLRHGVQLPASGDAFFTFDSALRRSPSRGWRRWGTRLTVQRSLRVLAGFHTAHPEAARVGVADLSRRQGGPFDSHFGGLGHASHQNGRDIDVYYPRKDRRERPPRDVGQIDRRLAQELVDRFVKAGAQTIFVGPHTRLRGPRDVVQILAEHDDHLHVRWPAR